LELELTSQIISIVIVGLQTAILALWVKQPVTHFSIAAAVLQLVSALAVVVLAIYEYPRTTRPSRTTTTYLLSAIAADCVLMRTLYIRDYIPKIGPVVSAAAACKLLLLLLESWHKTSYLKPTDEPFGPVDVASPINRAFLFWLNRLLRYGYGHILSLSDLYPLDQDLYSERLRVRMQHNWDKCNYPKMASSTC
jgi:ATP-binding cassette subfamily C (CFTR/MRP) protein 1